MLSPLAVGQCGLAWRSQWSSDPTGGGSSGMGVFMLVGELTAVRRAVRLVLRGLRLPVHGSLTYLLGLIIAGEMVLVTSDGTRETWTRAPAD